MSRAIDGGHLHPVCSDPKRVEKRYQINRAALSSRAGYGINSPQLVVSAISVGNGATGSESGA